MAEILSQVSQNTPNCALQSLQHPFTKLTISWGRLLDSPVPSPYFSIWSISTNLFSENCEHLKNFRNVDCVLANYNKVQDAQANLKPQTNYRCCWRFSYLVPYWLISRNTITIHKYSWCSRFCEFHSKCYF